MSFEGIYIKIDIETFQIKFFVFAGKRWSVIQPFHFKNDLILKEVVEETLSRLLQNFVEDYVLRGYTYGSSEEKDDSILNYTLGDICVTCQAKPHSMYMYFFYEALGGYQTYPFREQDHEGCVIYFCISNILHAYISP